MSATVLFKPCGVGNFEWLQLRGDRSPDAQDYAVGDGERLVQEAGESTLVYIAPAERIGLRQAAFEASEKKLLRQTLPYSLEEELIDDVDELHFALGETRGNTVDVAIVRREALEQWQQDLVAESLNIQQVVSELQLLPLEEDAWTLLIKDDFWLLRHGPGAGFALDPDVANLALQSLLDEAEQLPQRLLVFGHVEDREAFLSLLPEMLRGIVDWQSDGYWEMVERGYAQLPAPINLLQGEYAIGLPWKKWGRLWKLPLAFLAVALGVNIITQFVALQVLDHKNLELRRQTEQTYRSVVPRGAVMRPADQLRRKVEALRGGSGASFVAMLDKVAGVLASVEGLELQSLNYTERQSEMHITILVNGFNNVESTRASLVKAGLGAELTGSNAQGGKTRARLRIKGS